MNCRTVIVLVLVALTSCASGTPLKAVSESRNLPVVKEKLAVSPRDWLSDLIEIVFGEDAATFLGEIDRVLRLTVTNLEQAHRQIEDLIENGNSNVQTQLKLIKESTLNPALAVPGPVLADLAQVLPAISNKKFFRDVASIIEAILGKTFEIFLKYIGQSFGTLNSQLAQLYLSLENLANQEPTYSTQIRALNGLILPAWTETDRFYNYLREIVDIPYTNRIRM